MKAKEIDRWLLVIDHLEAKSMTNDQRPIANDQSLLRRLGLAVPNWSESFDLQDFDVATADRIAQLDLLLQLSQVDTVGQEDALFASGMVRTVRSGHETNQPSVNLSAFALHDFGSLSLQSLTIAEHVLRVRWMLWGR